MDSNNNLDKKDFLSVIEEDVNTRIQNLHTDLFKDRITNATKIKAVEPVIEIAESNFASKGDFSVIGGLPKAGKTSIAVYMLATALMKNTEGLDTLSIRTKYCENKPIFYFDTEQPKAYTNNLRKQILKVLATDTDPENLYIINLRQYSSEDKKKKILEWMKAYPNAHLWVIDGVADLIKDPNDTKEAFGIIETLMIQSDILDTTIIGYIHENPGTSGKLRGNLGSEAERKCGGAIAVKKLKDKGCHCIEAKMIRGAADFEPIFFRYDKELKRMVSIGKDESAELKKGIDKSEVKKQKLIDLAKRCLLTGQLSSGDLVERIMQNASDVEGKTFSKRTAETRLQAMKENGIISLNGDFYGIADKYIPQP